MLRGLDKTDEQYYCTGLREATEQMFLKELFEF